MGQQKYFHGRIDVHRDVFYTNNTAFSMYIHRLGSVGPCLNLFLTIDEPLSKLLPQGWTIIYMELSCNKRIEI